MGVQTTPELRKEAGRSRFWMGPSLPGTSNIRVWDGQWGGLRTAPHGGTHAACVRL